MRGTHEKIKLILQRGKTSPTSVLEYDTKQSDGE